VLFPDDGWTSSLKKLPEVRFPSIYQHFMEKSLVVYARCSLDQQTDNESDSDIFSSFKGIDKGYNFFKSGHVQKIELAEHKDYVFVRCDVLPSMKKTAAYKTKVCLLPTGMVNVARCSCTAGLGGCCNHVAALLYALEEFVRFGLREEVDETSPTSRLCRWNRPRSKRVEPRRVTEVQLHRPTFNNKRSRVRAAMYNPIPPNKRLVEPAEMEKLKSDLAAAHEDLLARDVSGNVQRYGSSTWLSAMADVTDSSSSSSSSSSDEVSSDDSDESSSADAPQAPPAQPKYSSPDELYKALVVVDSDAIIKIEQGTREQSLCHMWFEERRKRITATLCKSIVSRRSDDFTPIIRNKLCGTFRGNRATRYGQQHEDKALKLYEAEQQKASPSFSVKTSGLIVSAAWPWLAATPDGIADDQQAGKGVVEVKCPYSCVSQSLASAAAKSSFFLKRDGESLTLKRSHKYYFQVQFQMLVTGFKWADFVVWCPSCLFRERIAADAEFVEKNLPRLKAFYFNHYLPALYADSTP